MKLKILFKWIRNISAISLYRLVLWKNPMNRNMTHLKKFIMMMTKQMMTFNLITIDYKILNQLFLFYHIPHLIYNWLIVNCICSIIFAWDNNNVFNVVFYISNYLILSFKLSILLFYNISFYLNNCSSSPSWLCTL